MMENKNLDRLFQEKFKDFEVHPPKETWHAIEAELNKKEKKRIIPIWWKFSGVAALLVVGGLLFNTFNDKNTNSKPEFNPSTNIVVLENQGTENSENDSTILVDKENKTNQTIVPIANPVRNNQTVTTIDSNVSNRNTTKSKNDKSSLKSWELNGNSINSQASNEGAQNKAVVLNSDKEKENQQNQALTNNFNNNQSTDIQKTTTDKSVVTNENESKIDLNKYKTAEEINKIKKIDSTIVTAVAEATIEPNALEELLKEKEKQEKSVEPKINRWLVTSAVAPVYFNSASNGSPIDSEFESNKKEYENNLTFGVGIQYVVSKKISFRSGLNQVSLGYNTRDILYQASLSRTSMDNLSSPNNGASIVVMNKENGQTNSFQEVSNSDMNEGVLNQQMGYLEMPLELSYKLLDRKFGIQFIGGISTLFLTENQVVVRSPGYEFDLGEANNLNQVHFSSNVGIGFNYTFWKSFQANFEPMFKYQLNTFSNDSGNFKPYFIGLYSGISYRF